MRRYNDGYEFDDEKHLYSSVELTIWNAIRTMLKGHSLNKNNLPIDSECTLMRGDGEDSWSIYELNAVSDTKEYDNTMEWLLTAAEKHLDPIQMHIVERTMQGFTPPEIADEFEWSAQNVHTRLKTIVKILKKIKDAEKREIQPTVPGVRKNIKREPVREYTASHSRRSAASDFLNS
jgi:DNA-directed RNA polymerase specialized sigma24 family protein